MIWKSLMMVTPVAGMPLKVTVVVEPHENPEPQIVAGVPPADGPEQGEIAATARLAW